jgi:hypothetical protein
VPAIAVGCGVLPEIWRAQASVFMRFGCFGTMPAMSRVSAEIAESNKGGHMSFVYVTSDNFTGIATKQAYNELRLQMSSGDYGAHTAAPALPSLAAHFGYLEYDQSGDWFYTVEPETH